MINDLNTFVMDNVFIISFAIIITIFAMWMMNDRRPRRGRTIAQVSLGVGAFSLVYVLLGLILIIGAGSTVVIGRWFVYGDTPRGTVQWGLVFYAIFLLIAYSTGFFAVGQRRRRRRSRKK